MRFLFPSTSLNNILGGTLNAGTVPFARFLRFSGKAGFQNATIAAALTDLITPTPGTVVVGDMIEIVAFFNITKGGTTGDTICVVDAQVGGTVVIDTGNPNAADAHRARFEVPGQVNATVIQGCVTLMGDVTTGGSWTPKVQASSAGSNSTVNSGCVYYRCWAAS